jgi:hypothetical protein
MELDLPSIPDVSYFKITDRHGYSGDLLMLDKRSGRVADLACRHYYTNTKLKMCWGEWREVYDYGDYAWFPGSFDWSEPKLVLQDDCVISEGCAHSIVSETRRHGGWSYQNLVRSVHEFAQKRSGEVGPGAIERVKVFTSCSVAELVDVLVARFGADHKEMVRICLEQAAKIGKDKAFR